MMSPTNPPVKPASDKDETQNMSGDRKTGSKRLQEQALKCPRCDSPNTKFCYYNNYSLTQPRHFCKTCRRYWTSGGALRNVPIGGGCRKNNKIIKSSSRLLLPDDSKDPTSSSSLEMDRSKLFHGLSPPTMDFQFGGLSFPKLNPSPSGIYNQFTSPSFSLDPPGRPSSLMGFSNSQLSSVVSGLSGAIQMIGSMNANTSLASSIESLSSINQDLHWKLQQRRLAMIFGGDQNQKENSITVSSSVQIDQNQAKKPESISFQNLEVSNLEISAVENPRNGGSTSNEAAKEWFFGNSYAPVTPTPASTICSNGNDNISSNNWIGVQAWNHDLHQNSMLP